MKKKKKKKKKKKNIDDKKARALSSFIIYSKWGGLGIDLPIQSAFI
jgi:hypothetical protein